MSFNNKKVLVTGGSSGIGAAIAIMFASEGAKVAIVGRNENKLSSVAAQCENKGSKPLVIVADITKDEDLKKIMKNTIEHFEKLDVLVNNAGIGGVTSILMKDAMSVYDRVMATNLRSVVYLTHLAAPYLTETKGSIINISSIAGLGVISAPSLMYCTSKAALDHFTRCVALELASKGVRVNSVNPGPVRTNIIENMGVNKAHQEMVWKSMKKATALDRISDAEEVGDLVLFLASDKARSITGSTYVTDNGCLLKGTMLVE